MKPTLTQVALDGTDLPYVVPNNTQKLLICATLPTLLVWSLKMAAGGSVFPVGNNVMLTLDDPNLSNETIYFNGELGGVVGVLAFARTMQ